MVVPSPAMSLVFEATSLRCPPFPFRRSVIVLSASEDTNADSSVAALVLSHRLASAEPGDSVRSRAGPLRDLQPPSWDQGTMPAGWPVVRSRRTCWRDGHGNRCVPPWGPALDRLRVTRVILAAAHLDHDPMNSAPSNLKSLCQRCHMLHDRPYHLAQRWLTYRMRWAIGDFPWPVRAG